MIKSVKDKECAVTRNGVCENRRLCPNHMLQITQEELRDTCLNSKHRALQGLRRAANLKC